MKLTKALDLMVQIQKQGYGRHPYTTVDIKPGLGGWYICIEGEYVAAQEPNLATACVTADKNWRAILEKNAGDPNAIIDT